VTGTDAGTDAGSGAPAAPAHLGLRARPGPDAEVMAVLAASAWAVWARPVEAAPPTGPPPYLRWRFSGRWWAEPAAVRRSRP